MTVRRKIFLILVGSVSVLLGIIFLLTRLILERGISDQERLVVRGHVERVVQALNNEVVALDRLANDYSAWDDTYAFIRNPSKAYLDSNIVPTTFKNGQFNVMAFLDETGRVVHQAAYDETADSMIAIPEDLAEHLAPGRPLLGHAELKSSIKGYLALKDGIFLAAARPILTSDEEGPSRGTLVVARRLSPALVERFSQIVNIPLILERSGPAEKREGLAAGPGNSGTVPLESIRFLDSRRVQGDAQFSDLEGRPAFTLSFVIERSFRAQYLRTQRIYFGAIVMLSILSLMIIMIVIDRVVSARLSRLAKFVKQTETTGNLGLRINIKGDDEPAQLAKSINTLFDSLDRHVQRVRAAEDVVRQSEVKYRSLFGASTDPIFLETLDGRILDCNQSATALLGYSKDELLRMTVADIIPADMLARLPDVIRTLSDKESVILETENVAKNGEVIPVEISIRLARIGEENLAVVYIHDLRARRKAERAQAAVFDIATAAATADDLGELYGLVHAKVAALIPARNFHIAVLEDGNGHLAYPYFVDEIQPPPPPKTPGRGLTEYVFQHGEPTLITTERIEELCQQGEVEVSAPLPADWLGVPLGSEGKTIGVMAVQNYGEQRRFSEEDKALLIFMSAQVAMAIDRVRARERIKTSLHEKDILLREVHHRVKNNMQVISSLFNLTSAEILDPSALNVLRECQARIRTMALVHEKLYQSRDLSRIDFSEYIQTLALHLFHFWNASSDRIRLTTSLEPVFLDVNAAIPCGLIINELISNALEHAFPNGREGKVRIALRPTNRATYELIVEDDGVGIPPGLDPAQTESLGLQLIHLLVQQLDGKITISREGGTRFEISFREMRFRTKG